MSNPETETDPRPTPGDIPAEPAANAAGSANKSRSAPRAQKKATADRIARLFEDLGPEAISPTEPARREDLRPRSDKPVTPQAEKPAKSARQPGEAQKRQAPRPATPPKEPPRPVVPQAPAQRPPAEPPRLAAARGRGPLGETARAEVETGRRPFIPVLPPEALPEAPPTTLPAAEITAPPPAPPPAIGLPAHLGSQAVRLDETDIPVPSGSPSDIVQPAATPATPVIWESWKQQKPIIQPGQPEGPAVLAYARPLLGLGIPGPESLPGGQAGLSGPAAAASLLVEVLDDDPQRSWSDDEISLVEQVTDQLSLALENARLFQEARTRAEQLAILNEMSRQLSTQLKLEDVYQTIYTFASRLLDTTNFYIAIYHDDTNLLDFPIVYIDGERIETASAPLGEGLTEYIIRHRQPLLFSENVLHEMERRGIAFVSLSDDLPPVSWLGVPMLFGGKVVGVISVQSVTTPRLYAEQHLELLTAVANQAVVAIQNAVLFEQTQNALSALAISERLQKSIAQAVAALTERGLAALTDVLQNLGEATGAGRTYYFQVHLEPGEAPVWRLAGEWTGASVEPQASQPLFQHLPITNTENWLKILKNDGVIAAQLSHLSGPERAFLEQLGAQSTLQFAVPGQYEIPGCLGFEERTYERLWTEDEIAALQTVASALASTVAREDLFTQLQVNLSETETLYQASAELNAVQSYDDVLQTLRRHSVLSQVDYYISIDLFNHPWVGQNPADMPERCTTIARWNHLPREAPARNRGDQYSLREMPGLARILRPDRLTLVRNLGGDVELDETARSLYLDGFQAKSTLFVPLVVGGLWIGYINAVYGIPAPIQAEDFRRLEVLANQAAIAVQNLRQLQQIQARAQYEYLTREIGAQISSTIDEDTILRTTARSIGQALGATHVMVSLKSRKVVDKAHPQGYLYESHADRFSLSDTPEMEALLRSVRQAQSSLQVPIILRNDEIGAIEAFDAKKSREWTTNDTTLVQTVSAQVALALDNARLFRETQTALTETETLYQASAELNAARGQDEILQVIRKYTMLGEADNLLSLSVFDQPWDSATSPQWVIPVARHTTLSLDRVRTRYALEEYPAHQLLSPSEPVIIEAIADDPRLDEHSRRLFGQAFLGQSAALFPLVVGGSWVGFITAVFSLRTHLDEIEVRRITALAGQAAVAMQNLRLLEVSLRRAGQLQTAAEIARDTSSTLALDTLLQRSVNLLCDRFGYYHASIFLLDETGMDAAVRESTGAAGEEMKRRSHKLPVGSRSVIGQVTLTGQPMLLNDVGAEEARSIHRFNPLLPHTRAELGMPLKIGTRVIGALDVQATRVNAFTEDDVAVLQILADQVAVAVDNARVYELAQKAMEEIREADRLKSQFLANMSHELRTPLNSIIGFSRVILKGIDGPITDQQTQDLTAIYNSGQHLLGLINDVLDLSRIEAGKMELSFENNVNLVDIIKGVMSTTVGLVKDKPIVLKQEIDPELPQVRADSIKVRQVLLNLLSNAAKFTEQGSITVRASVQLSPEGDPEVLIQVIDTGPGISPADQAKLFQPFSQVDGSLTRKSGGSGLGLSISQHLVWMHGGQIGLDSEESKGSTFYFTLPISGPPQSTLEQLATTASNSPAQLARPAPAAPVVAEAPKPNLPTTAPGASPEAPAVRPKAQPPAPDQATAVDKAHFTILAVDKDPKVIDLYKRYLQKEFGSETGEQSFNVIALMELEQVVTIARGIQPLAITLDVTLQSPTGQLDGWKVLEALKADPATQNIPVIICTLIAEQERASSLGAAEYLMKPILEEDLILALRRVYHGSPRP